MCYLTLKYKQHFSSLVCTTFGQNYSIAGCVNQMLIHIVFGKNYSTVGWAFIFLLVSTRKVFMFCVVTARCQDM
jgi:hypothetical protein